MDCSPWLERCSARLDGELDLAESQALDAHLAVCGPCREAARAMEDLHRALRLRPAPPLPDRTAEILAAAKSARARRRRVPAVAAAAVVAALAAGGLAWATSQHPSPSPALSLLGARVVAAPAGGVTAAYVYVENGGGDDRLVAVESPMADRAELHRTDRDDGIALMHTVTSLPVPAAGATELTAGGAHLMLLGLHGDLTPGARVPLTLRFARAGEISVQATVEPA
jgi:periplasmic copper chaperone A